jgi:O-antigen ligase
MTNQEIINTTCKIKSDCWLACAVLLLATFFIGVNVPFRAPSYAFMGLTLLGMAHLFRYPRFDEVDRRYFFITLIIPAIYLINMAVYGWAPAALDRPLRLLWAVPIFLLFRKISVRFWHLLVILAITSLWMAFAGIYHVLLQGEERGFSGFMKTGPYGNYAAVFFAIGVFVIFKKRDSLLTKESICAFVLLVFSAVSMIVSGTRSAWAGALIMVVMICIYRGCKFGFSIFYDRAVLVTVAVLALLLLLAGHFVADRLQIGIKELVHVISAPNSKSANETSIGQRIVSWKMGIELFEDKPTLGVGLANFKSEVKRRVERDNLPREIEGYNGLHNFVIDHLAKTGVVGTVGIVLFWFLMFRFFYLARPKGGDAEAAKFIGILVLAGEIVFSSVGSMFASSIGSSIFVMLMTILAALSTKNADSFA